MGDQTIADVRTNRDSRLSLFLKEPGQTNIVWDDQPGQSLNLIEPVPNIIVGDMQRAYTTGYALLSLIHIYIGHINSQFQQQRLTDERLGSVNWLERPSEKWFGIWH